MDPREELIKILNGKPCMKPCTEECQYYTERGCDAAALVADYLLERGVSVHGAPGVRAKWEIRQGSVFCNRCGVRNMHIPISCNETGCYISATAHESYCFSCGARMDFE